MSKLKVTPTPKRKPGERETVTVRTAPETKAKTYQWWLAPTIAARAQECYATVSYLKENQKYRERQRMIFGRLYSNDAFLNASGIGAQKINQNNALPFDRPTMNVIGSVVDTQVSRIGQNTPNPMFLTDYSNWQQRRLAKQLNEFVLGEFYQTDLKAKATLVLRDAGVFGTGFLKVYEAFGKVAVDRVHEGEIFVDYNEAFYGEPRTLYQLKLVDRTVLNAMFPGRVAKEAEKSYVDSSAEATETTSDLVLVVEGWRLPSCKDAGDGFHVICCDAGSLLDEAYTKLMFPFAKLEYNPRLTGYFGQGVAEMSLGCQFQINKLLQTITQSINLIGVPRIFIENSSKIVSAHLNNMVGGIVKYTGEKPIYEVAPCIAPEIYTQLQRIIDYVYNQHGVSELSASSDKPPGLDSGAALREYDAIQTGRSADLAKRFDELFVKAAYLIVDVARDIAVRDGKYQTIYPGKNGVSQIDLPKADLLENPFVIRCFNTSSLPQDPAGRMQQVVEMIQSGMVSVREGRRLLDYPDLGDQARLDNAAEELILKTMDAIVDSGNYTPPDPFWDLDIAPTIAKQYYNLYMAANLPESKLQLLRTFVTQVMTLEQAATPPAPMGMPGGAVSTPQASPEALPTSPMIPNVPQGIAS